MRGYARLVRDLQTAPNEEAMRETAKQLHKRYGVLVSVLRVVIADTFGERAELCAALDRGIAHRLAITDYVKTLLIPASESWLPKELAGAVGVGLRLLPGEEADDPIYQEILLLVHELEIEQCIKMTPGGYVWVG